MGESAWRMSELARTNALKVTTKVMQDAEYVPIELSNNTKPHPVAHKQVKSPSKELSVPEGIKILEELAAGYKDPSFQNGMQLIYKQYFQDGKESNLSKARKELLLSIQGKVIRKYGFEATTAGVMKCHVSLKALEREDNELFKLNEEVTRLSQTLPRQRAEQLEEVLTGEAQPEREVPVA